MAVDDDGDADRCDDCDGDDEEAAERELKAEVNVLTRAFNMDEEALAGDMACLDCTLFRFGEEEEEESESCWTFDITFE